MRFRRTKSRCSECPLAGRKQVWGMTETDVPRIAMIGEAPGEEEEREGKPFVGPTGRLLMGKCSEAGIMWRGVYRTNVIACRPPNNNINGYEAKAAIEACKPGFEEELEAMEELGITTIGAVGGTAATALGIPGKIHEVRGSVYRVGSGMAAVPTFHPSYIIRGAWSEEPVWVADLRKIRDISISGWDPPSERFNIYPTVEQVEKFARQVVKKKQPVGVDIEGFKRILMVGLSTSGEDALVIPFVRQFGFAYWDEPQERRVKKALGDVLRYCPTIYQNAQFDVYALEQAGYTVGNIAEDTMILHHCIHPELPHNLGYIVSIYGNTPYWKGVVKKSDEAMYEIPDVTVRTYNARDTVVLHQILPGMLEDLKEVGTESTYRDFGMKLLRPLMAMKRKGVLVDKKKMVAHQRKFKRTAEKLESEIRTLLELPVGFNLDSNQHVTLLLFGVRPNGYDKAVAEKGMYDGDPKRRKDTKKYRDLVDRVKLVEEVVPLRLPTSVTVRKTKGGAPSCDDASLQTVQRAAINRIEAMEYLVRKTEKHEVEAQELERTLKFIELYRKWSEAHKMAGTYSKYPLGVDGRIHANYKIHGTATGRLSSSDPNMQNQPEGVQDIFVVPPGYVMIKADYSNIEVRVMAYLSREQVLIDAFKKGINIHDLNTKIMFEIDESHPNWKTIRRAAKVFVFGRSYGGSVEGIYKEVITQVPEARLSLSKFQEADRKYFDNLKGYAAWCKKQIDEVTRTRTTQTAFGRKRFLLGTEDEIKRQALNTPIQGTAGEVAEKAIIDCHTMFAGKPAWDAALVATVHDSILVECKEEYAMEVMRGMKRVMEQKFKINGQTVSFPVDFEFGPSWGTTTKVEL